MTVNVYSINDSVTIIMKVYKVNLISFFLCTIGGLDGKLSEKMLVNKRKENVDENLTPG